MRATSRAAAFTAIGACLLVHAARSEATVPMDPQYLPEAALLLAGLFLGAIGLHRLLTRQLGSAMKAGAACAVSVTLAFVLANNGHNPPRPAGLQPAATSSMSLVLGDVVLRVAPSNRYVFSVNDKEFLELDLARSGLTVSGVVGARDKAAASIERNTFPVRRTGIRPSKPDSHTLLVQEDGEDIFRVQYSEPRMIEVTGEFFERRSAEPALISFQEGIHWSGGSVGQGTVIDLRSQSGGRINFAPSGQIRVLPL